MYCKSCGCTMPEGNNFCPACGARFDPVPEMPEMPKMPVVEAAREPSGPPPSPPQYPSTPPLPHPPYSPAQNPVPHNQGQPYSYAPYAGASYAPAPSNPYDDTSPLGMGSYLLYLFLFSIPFVGFVLQLVFAFSQGNVNRKNLARAYLLFQVIAVVASFVLLFLIGLFFAPYMEELVGAMGYY